MHSDLYHAVYWSKRDLLAVSVELHKGIRLVRYGGSHDSDARSIDEEEEGTFELRTAHHAHLLTDLRKVKGGCGGWRRRRRKRSKNRRRNISTTLRYT